MRHDEFGRLRNRHVGWRLSFVRLDHHADVPVRRRRADAAGAAGTGLNADFGLRLNVRLQSHHRVYAKRSPIVCRSGHQVLSV
jgi:hypothetical protein